MRFLMLAIIIILGLGAPTQCGLGGNTSNGPGGGASPGAGGGVNSPGPFPILSPGLTINTLASPSSGGNCQTVGGVVTVQAGPGCGASSSPNTGASSPPAPVGQATPTPASVGQATPTPSSGSSSSPSGASTMSKITFYNVASSGNALTSSGVPTHEGSGSFSDPITFATAPNEVPMQGLIYVKGFNKYFIHTDTCVSCTTDWASGTYHQDLWLGTDSANCAITWGVLQLPIVINPSSSLPVSSQAMDDGTCFPLPSPLPTS